VDKVSGTDINGDGKPELVLDGYSGGARCRYTYTILSLGRTQQVLRNIHSQAPMFFEKQPDGATLVRAADSVFDYFVVPHSEAVIPHLILQMEGKRLVDISSQFYKQYDAEIEQARQPLSNQISKNFASLVWATRCLVTRLPLCTVYSLSC
jgi:hypothetical protein